MSASKCENSCIVCKDLDPAKGSDEGIVIEFIQRMSLKQIKDSSASCRICLIILQGVTEFMPDSVAVGTRAEYRVEISAWTKKEIGTLECQIYVRDYSSLKEGDVLRPSENRGTTIYNTFLEFYISEGQNRYSKAFGRARTAPSPTYLALEPEGLVHRWLEECSSNHTECKMAVEQPLSTRVIDVFGNELSGGQPFLYETRGEIERYICLSYCWGGIEFLITTSETLEQRKRSIAWGEVPQTFADAIWVARSLRVRYLWIDSLCIIQDDPDDWMRESTAMATVYGHSYLTIAAIEAPNATSGMFYATENSTDSPSQITVLPSGSQTQVNVRNRLPHHKEETISPLSKRGWAFQESILPKRIIRLGLFELLWECNQISACCCTINPQSNRELKSKYASSLGQKEDVSAAERWNLWTEILFEYTSRALTRGTDKLIALSGVANSVQALWNCRYIAGLWEKHILTGLRWQQNGRFKRTPRPQPYRAPTWSWASVDGQIVHPYTFYETGNFFQVTFINARCDLESDSPTGSISGGHLTISGKIVEVEYIFESHSEAGLFGGSDQCDSLYFKGHHESFQADVKLEVMTEEGVPEVQEAYCLLLGAFGERPPPPPPSISPTAEMEQECSVLVLQKCSNSLDRFKRIGIINGYNGLETWFEGVEDQTLILE